MARKKQTAMVKWEEELARDAQAAAEMEANAGGGQFFSIRSGVLSWNDSPLPNNEMAVIIIDSIFENVHYEGDYDPDVPQGPTCFAFGRNESELAPHESVVSAGTQECDNCDECPKNEWGSADKGRGKACSNTRRLAMIPAGKFDRNGEFGLVEDVDHYTSATIGFMKLPVTSVKGYANFVKQVAGALKRPPYGIVTRVHVVADPKTQFKVVFEPLMNVPDEFLGAVMERREEAKSTIDFPYQLDDFEEATAKPQRKKKAAARKKTASRRARKY